MDELNLVLIALNMKTAIETLRDIYPELCHYRVVKKLLALAEEFAINFDNTVKIKATKEGA